MNYEPSSERDVLVSIRPKYASKILEGKKTVELRRKFSERTTKGNMALIYSSSPEQAIVGFARIKEVLKLPINQIWRRFSAAACISQSDFDQYFNGLDYGFAIILENARALNRKLKAHDLREKFNFIPPQSFRYLNGEYTTLLSNERIQISNRHERRYRS